MLKCIYTYYTYYTIHTFCSPSAVSHSTHLKPTSTASHTFLIKATPVTCSQSDWLTIKTPALPRLAARLVFVCKNELISVCQPCLNSGIVLSLLSPTMDSAFMRLFLCLCGLFFYFCTGFIVCAVLNFTCWPFLLYHPVSAANYIVNITVYICEIFILFFY